MSIWINRDKRIELEDTASKDKDNFAEHIFDTVNEKCNRFTNIKPNFFLFNFLPQFKMMSPFDIYISIHEWLVTRDWDKKLPNTAIFIGNVFTFTYYGIRLLQDYLIKPNYFKLSSRDYFDFSRSDTLRKYDYFQRFMDSPDSQNHFAHNNLPTFINSINDHWHYRYLKALNTFLNFLTFLLILINFMTTFKFLFASTKEYSIFYFKRAPNSSHVVKKSLVDLSYQYLDNESGFTPWNMLTYLLPSRFTQAPYKEDDFEDENSPSGLGATSKNKQEKKYYYQLYKWSPSPFTTSLFTSFNPIVVVFLFFSDTSFLSFIAIVLNQYLFYELLIVKYESRIEDELVLSSALLEETNIKYRDNVIHPVYQDAMVNTNLDGTDNFIASFKPFNHLNGEKFITKKKINNIVTTHALSGDLIYEKFNKNAGDFEKLRKSSVRTYISKK
ncbi:uncharacterized protein SCODWIG_02169 [Saccharomycodes ludwigii]|uniref:Nuclear rim protein 1 n=1 Tax=Saccharomycodes ludwigii TaxID=36035 RepID=A0A376B6W5_9ASCO|nr:uncharacterized protein SCODWIG_02169 [Saccharomycodes ludwigii]